MPGWDGHEERYPGTRLWLGKRRDEQMYLGTLRSMAQGRIQEFESEIMSIHKWETSRSIEKLLFVALTHRSMARPSKSS